VQIGDIRLHGSDLKLLKKIKIKKLDFFKIMPIIINEATLVTHDSSQH